MDNCSPSPHYLGRLDLLDPNVLEKSKVKQAICSVPMVDGTIPLISAVISQFIVVGVLGNPCTYVGK